MNSLIPWLVITLFFLILSCSSTDTNDIPEQKLYLEPFFKNVSDDDEYILTRPIQFRIDGGGNIYILDIGEKRIMVYSPEGEFVRQIGREGEGPGEIMGGIVQLAIDGNDVLYLADNSLNRVTLFDTKGHLLDSFPVTENFITSMAVSNEGEIALLAPEIDGPIVKVYNRKGDLVRTIGETEPLGNLLYPHQHTPDATINKNQGHIAFTPTGELYIVFGVRPVIRKYAADGRLLYERILESADIDLLIERKRQAYQNHDSLTPNTVIVLAFFNDILFLDDHRSLIMVTLQDLLYEIDAEGNIVKAYRIKNLEEHTGTDRVELQKIAQSPDGSLLALDPWVNAAVYRLVGEL